MTQLTTLTNKLDHLFGVKELDKDPSMDKSVAEAYSAVNFDWQNFFEPDFVSRFNGLMIKGADDVSQVFCSVYPAPEVMEKFIQNSSPGDLLFLHHPIFMECGDPQGPKGRGFLPIAPDFLGQIKNKQLSVYSCHAPMDCHPSIGTNAAIVQALGVKVIDNFLKYGNGFAGRICQIDPISTDQLIDKLKNIFDIPYVDFDGQKHEQITTIAIVAGGGCKAGDMQDAKNKKVRAYITGEIHNRIDNERGRQKLSETQEYAQNTTLSLIGVSHSASEQLVMKTQMIAWFKDNFKLPAQALPMLKWWR